jgi:hypothetical protein
MKSQSKRQNRARAAARQERNTIFFIIAASMALLVFAIAYTQWSSKQTAAFAYNPNELATEKPFSAGHAMGEGPPIPFLPKDSPQPKIVVSERSYNFGSIGPNDIVQRTFAIRNDGDAPLTISRAYTTCGCTRADFSASVIPPGKVAEVFVTYDAGFHDSRGQTVSRGIIIESNDPQRSQSEIWVQASVRSN